MKKTLASFLTFFLALSAPAVFAQMPLGAPMAPAAAPAFEKIGIVAAAQGTIELKTPGQVGRIAKSGQPIFMGDEVKTSAEGHLQILLLDETVFTIGPNSLIVIDQFVYDPKSHAGEIRASIVKGVFRYVSGKIAAKNSDSVKMKLPTATIGFRGTIVGGSVAENGQGLAALLGPGDNNDAGAQSGSFTIQGAGGDHQDVNRTGFGVEVGADGGLSGVFQLSDNQINGLTSGLAPSGNQSGGNDGGGSVTDQSGESTVLTGENSNVANAIEGLSNSNDDASTTAAQDAAAENAGIANGVTTMEQLSRIQTGIFHYYGTGTYNGMGTMTAQVDIDFGARTIGGGNSSVSVSYGGYTDTTSGVGSVIPFGNSGPATFHWSNVSGTMGGTFNNIDVTLGNSGGVVANQANVTTDYSGGMVPTGSGSASGSRVDGPSEAPVA